MAEKSEKQERKKKETLRHKLRLRMTEWARAHAPLFETLDNVTWGLSGAFVLAFLFWFQAHPYPLAIGLGLLVLLVKLLFIVINPKREEKKEEGEEGSE